MTSFSLEEAIQFRNRLQQYKELYDFEWSSVMNRWQDLQSVWQDSSCIEFERNFQQFIQPQDKTCTNLEIHLQEIDRTIEVIGKMKETLPNLDSSVSDVTNSRPQSVPTTAFSNKDGSRISKEAYSKLTEQDIQDWQKTWIDVSKSVTPFFNNLCAVSAVSLSFFLGAMNSPPVAQVMKLTRQGLVSGINFIVEDSPNIIDLNDATLGSDWSNLPDESIPKVISKIMEDADKLHFGNSEIADLIGDYADNEEEKRKRRLHEQKILNQLRSQYSQNSKRK